MGKGQTRYSKGMTEALQQKNQEVERLRRSNAALLKAGRAISQLLYYDREAGHFALAHPENYPTIDEDAVTGLRAAIEAAEGKQE